MENLDFITWFGHASFAFKDTTTGQQIYYIDPFQLPSIDLQKADLIFVTHAHQDHMSPQDINLIIKETCVVIAPPDCLAQMDLKEEQKQTVEPHASYEVKGFKFQTIPAYNIKPERLQAHPKSNNWVGYIFTVNGKKIYHAGDTDFTDEMKQLKDLHLDIAMLPMGGKYTMPVEETIEAANTIAAKITIPMHYKRLLGEGYKDAEERLRQGVTNSKVIILPELS